MNCRDVTPLLSAERDGPLDAVARQALERHVAACPACRHLRATLSEAADVWRDNTARAATPDPAGEWRTLRAQLHAAKNDAPRAALRRLPSWLLTVGALPAAAAAVWLAMLALDPHTPPTVLSSTPTVALAKPAPTTPSPAGADYVDTPADTTPVVYLDQESGWLIVWAESPAPPVSG
jgi:anti-sigma factor RsiW